MPPAIPNSQKIKIKAEFVAELRAGSTPAKAARAANISRALAYEWRFCDFECDQCDQRPRASRFS